MNDVVDVLSGFGINIRRLHAELLNIFKECIRIFLRNFLRRNTQLIGAFDDFVIDVGEIHHKAHLIAAIAQIAAKGVEHDERPRVANVKIIIHRRPAEIKSHPAGRDGNEFFFLAGESVVEFEGHKVSTRVAITT